eukprot:TRINITY_DN4123_c0_g1_i1.p1 TRINITY_DN4123_c0_g1~~TRINITY_DN4123_c0_g1_i1.p1  ORF type:complete len:315 (+),score=72.72 TRINITY_DN4123_c0_g1_i1:245-1189(+)
MRSGRVGENFELIEQDFKILDNNEEKVKELKIISFNVLFEMEDDFGKISPVQIRTKGLFELLSKYEDVHIIVLQEVTKNVYLEMLKQPFIKKYNIANIDPNLENSFEPYGNVILSKFPFVSIPELCLFNVTKKTFLNAKLRINGRDCSIFALHLKAGSFKTDGPSRKNQIEYLITLQKELDCQDMFMAGDFNFRESEGEDDIIENYKDFFEVLNKDEDNKGYTFDEYTNPMANLLAIIKCNMRNKKNGTNKEHRLEQRRYDRLFYSTDYWIPTKYTIIANQKIDTVSYNDKDADVFISDHFGVEFVFKCSEFDK